MSKSDKTPASPPAETVAPPDLNSLSDDELRTRARGLLAEVNKIRGILAHRSQMVFEANHVGLRLDYSAKMAQADYDAEQEAQAANLRQREARSRVDKDRASGHSKEAL